MTDDAGTPVTDDQIAAVSTPPEEPDQSGDPDDAALDEDGATTGVPDPTPDDGVDENGNEPAADAQAPQSAPWQ